MPDDADLPRRVTRKVALRTLPLLFALYVVAYLDRANVGFAKLRMSDALGLRRGRVRPGRRPVLRRLPRARNPGRAARGAVERPQVVRPHPGHVGLLLHGHGVRHHADRVLRPAVPAGARRGRVLPRVIVYFTHWFPRAERARALTGMLVGIPISLALGAVVSRWLLDQAWLGYAGWQWVFLAEGARSSRAPALRGAGHGCRASRDRDPHGRRDRRLRHGRFASFPAPVATTATRFRSAPTATSTTATRRRSRLGIRNDHGARAQTGDRSDLGLGDREVILRNTEIGRRLRDGLRAIASHEFARFQTRVVHRYLLRFATPARG